MKYTLSNNNEISFIILLLKILWDLNSGVSIFRKLMWSLWNKLRRLLTQIWTKEPIQSIYYNVTYRHLVHLPINSRDILWCLKIRYDSNFPLVIEASETEKSYNLIFSLFLLTIFQVKYVLQSYVMMFRLASGRNCMFIHSIFFRTYW